MESYKDVTRSSNSFVPFSPLSTSSSIKIYRPHIDSFNRGKIPGKSWALSDTEPLLDAVGLPENTNAQGVLPSQIARNENLDCF